MGILAGIYNYAIMMLLLYQPENQESRLMVLFTDQVYMNILKKRILVNLLIMQGDLNIMPRTIVLFIV